MWTIWTTWCGCIRANGSAQDGHTHFDIGLLNALVVMREVNLSLTTAMKNSFRYSFLLEVGYQLLDAEIIRRILQVVSKQTYTAMEFLGYKREAKQQPETREQRRILSRYVACGRKSDKKTTQMNFVHCSR